MPATKLSHLGFTAWVMCENERMPVYGVEFNGNASSCWIASEADKSFEVYINTSLSDQDTSCKVYVDGTRVASCLLGFKNYLRWHVRGAKSGSSSIRKMYFSAVALADDDQQIPVTAGNVAHLGTIRIEMWRCKVGARTMTSSKPYPTETLASSVVIHEREKKLGSHHTRLGEELPWRKRNHYQTEWMDDAPCAVLDFRYRPKAILQAHGIVDVEPSSHPKIQSVPKKRKADSQPQEVSNEPSAHQDLPSKKSKVDAQAAGSHKDYVRNLEERLRALEAQLPGVADQVKLEQNASRVPFPFKNGEVIDLTNDDN